MLVYNAMQCTASSHVDQPCIEERNIIEDKISVIEEEIAEVISGTNATMITDLLKDLSNIKGTFTVQPQKRSDPETRKSDQNQTHFL